MDRVGTVLTEATRVSGHFEEYGTWPWARFNSLERQLNEHPTFVIAEFLFLALAALSLHHAFVADPTGARRLKLLWVATFIVGTANDYFFMLLPVVDNFWQAQALVMLTPRMPLYIPCVYNGFMYWSTMAAARVFRYQNKCPFAEASLAGVLAGILYAPYDVCGAKFLWWTWHHDDAAVRLRWLGVPAGSTSWTIIFTFCFAYLLRRGEDTGLDQLQSLLLSCLSTPMMLALMGPFTILGFDTLGLISSQTVVASAVVFGAVVVCRMISPSAEPPKVSLRSPEPALVRRSILAYFVTVVLVMLLFSPENQISTGVHQKFGDCSSRDVDMMSIPRQQYICNASYPSEYFTTDCPAGDPTATGRWKRVTPEAGAKDVGGLRLASWYTVCGVKHTSWGRHLVGVALLCVVGAALYGWAFDAVDEDAGRQPTWADEAADAGWTPPLRAPSVVRRAAERKRQPAVGRDGRVADMVADRAARRTLTPFGQAVSTALDPVLKPVVDKHPQAVSLVLTAAFVALMFVAGRALSAVYPSGSEGTLLQAPYDAVRAMGMGYAGHPLFNGVFSMVSYAVLVTPYTIADVLRPQAAKDIMITPREAGDFGGPSLGVWRAIRTQLNFAAWLAPVFLFQFCFSGPKLYPAPWAEPCLLDCDLKLPDAAPSVFEFLLHSFFCVVMMDFSYWYYHMMLHRHRSLYRAVHALHHEYRQPFALVTQHAHPLELLATGVFSMAGPVACGAHPFTMWWWLLMSIFISIEAHSGYRLPLGLDVLSCGLFGGTLHHDVHHQSPWCNYQPFLCYLDNLCGTDAKGAEGHVRAPELEGGAKE
eukprot:TRINITY_DN1900_c0_g1_i1.p1 TRINITY_DN1900_c0_g1~~TRINITY_DN1900_c0_g1_i1.p1  ORF type:complete len:847 (+),score=314.39 TRINITY_DN1900_c0_g1_i1:90-2543(+)